MWAFVYAFVLLFLLSPDSYIRDLYGRWDSACFFMSGKAWMNGLVPYVDFADSKGPLLWLIYGIGYLLNHYSYVGVFWLSVLWYTATLFIAYKLCRLFTGKEVAAVSVAAMPLLMFYTMWHFEIRAEDFCYPFIMFSLYACCRVLRDRESDRKTYLRLSAAMGACCMCCVLIKYSVGAMVGSLMLVVLYMAARHGAGRQSFLGMVVGFVVPAVPFIVCFLIYGNLGAFVQEYFLNTFVTIANKTEGKKLGVGFLFTWEYVLILLLGVLLFSRRYKIGYWIAACFVFFKFCMGVRLSIHYMQPALLFSLFFIVAVVDFVFEKAPVLKRYATTLCILAVAVVIGRNWHCRQPSYEKRASQRQEWYRAECLMAQIEKPKVMYSGVGNGCGLLAGSLPACRYWIGQTGKTEDMVEARKKALREQRADFVILNIMYDEGDVQFVEDCGYVFYLEDVGGKPDKPVLVYGKPGLKMPEEDVEISQWDVWLKRNPLRK